MKAICVLVGFMSLAACGGPTTVTYQRIGKIGPNTYFVRCLYSIAGCYKHSYTPCPGGYRVIDKGTDGEMSFRGSSYRGAYSGSTANNAMYELIIKCKGGGTPVQPGEVESGKDCRASAYCKQLGRCRYSNGKCVR